MTAPTPSRERPAAQLADWRFVLAPPPLPSGRFARLVVLGGPDDAPEQLRRLDVAERVSPALDADGSADAIVVLPPARPSPARLRATIAPHGQIYIEHDRAAGRGGALDPMELRRNGFAIHGLYAVPPLDQPRRYVPLDDARALRWYFSTMYRPLTTAQRVANAVVPLLATLGSGTWLMRLARTTCIVAGPAAAPARATLGATLAQQALGHTPAPRLIVIGDGGDRVVLLPFAAGGSHAPAAVLKVPRTRAFESRTSEEHARVHELRRQLPAALRESIPEPLALARVGGHLVAAEQLAAGCSMLVSSGRAGASPRTQVGDLVMGMRWLAAFHSATIRERLTVGHLRAALLDQPIGAYVSHFGCTDEERALFDVALAHAAAHEAIELPIGRTHGDFAVWNLLRDGERLAVIDWEGSAAGPGYGDALHFATSWDLAVRRPMSADAELGCFARLFLEPEHHDRLHAAAMAALAEYRRAMGVDDRVAPLLLLHHRLELALRRRQQQVDAREVSSDARSGNRAVAAVRLLARQRQRFLHATVPNAAGAGR